MRIGEDDLNFFARISLPRDGRKAVSKIASAFSVGMMT